MEMILFIYSLTILLYIFISIVLSKEALLWEPSQGKRILLLMIIWLIPLIGAFICYQYLGLNWFKSRKKKSTNEQSNLSGALLEIDSIFNPGQRHVVEQKQKENIEQKENASEGNDKHHFLK